MPLHSMNGFLRRAARPLCNLSLASLLALCWACQVRAEGGPGEGTDIEIGSPGSEPGQFLGLQDIAFDAQNRLFVLEGRYWDGKQWQLGNCRVQVFDNDGKYLDQFSVLLQESRDNSNPARLAVDSKGNVYVTQPTAGLVVQYALAPPPAGAQAQRGNTWRVANAYSVADAYAIAAWRENGRERIVVMQNRRQGNQDVAFDRVSVIDPEAGKLLEPLQLSRPLANVQDLETDARGSLYVLADVNQVHKFEATGKLLAVLGAGTFRRASDGSELRHAVAVDSLGNLYSQAFGNIARFDAELKTVTLKAGQFYWYDNWSPHDAYTPLAIDHNDRLWVGASGEHQPDRWHYRPCVMRTRADFFKTATVQSTKLLGLDAVVSVKLPYNIAYDLAPIPVEFVLRPATRQVKDLTVEYRVHDVYKAEVAKGSFSLKLEDGAEARQALTFTPPRWGWYTVECLLSDQGGFLMGVGAHVGVTPKFPGMPVLAEGESAGGWVDPPRHGFCGVRSMRVNTGQGADTIEKAIQEAQKYGVTLLVQFESKDSCTPEKVREAVTRFKGRVRYWEIVNEPNFSMSPDDYAALLKQVVPIIKEVDPQAQVMGPTVCGINLAWNEAVFRAGGGKLLDIISIHDYEGNESIDPGHWRWKIGALREVMARYGLGEKAIWQTERAIGGVRADNFLGGVQAVRVGLQRDVLETLGIPNQHNLHYYMNQAGYAAVPTYLWSDSGPHPAALALRTREAMVLGRKFAGALDFGPNGNRIFLALRYVGTDGSTILLRQYGAAADPQLELGAKGGTTLEVVDSFGNSQALPIRQGKVTLTVPLLPIYLRLAKGQEIVPPRLDFGRNYAAEASFSYSGRTKSDMGILTNGLLEVTHADNPWGPYWAGDLANAPQMLDMTFPVARTVDRVMVYSMRADNPHCYLLDFDLQCHDGKQWVTLEEVRTPCPPSDLVRTADSKANTWYMDQNLALVEFPPITTNRLRLVARRSTLGFHPDAIAVQATGWQAGPPTLALREMEVYGPPPRVEVGAALKPAPVTAAFEQEPLAVTITNRGKNPVNGVVKVTVPPGWAAKPAEVPVTLGAHQAKSATVTLSPPAEIPTGKTPVELTLTDARGQPLDFTRAMLTVASPVQVTPQTPGAINQAQQPMSVTIKNLTPEPLSGVVRLTLTGKGAIGPLEKAFDAIPPQGSANVALLVPGLRFGEAAWRATYAVAANHLVTTSEQEFAAVRLWQVVGPFPNEGGGGFDAVYEPEKGVDVTKSIVLPNGNAARWKPAANGPTGFLDLLPLFEPNNNVCAYAAIYVKTPAARRAMLSVGSDDGIKAWINGKLVVTNNVSRGAAPGQEQVVLDLDAGWNEVLLKITQGTGGWGFYFELLTPDGQPMPDLIYAPTKEQ